MTNNPSKLFSKQFSMRLVDTANHNTIHDSSVVMAISEGIHLIISG